MLDPVFGLMSTIVYVGSKRDAWEYPEHSMRARANNPSGYVFKGASFPEDGGGKRAGKDRVDPGAGRSGA